jgi:ACS family glucarate transporter-like MFS transporter
MYFCTNYGWYFFMYFLPGFMKQEFSQPGDDAASKVRLALLMGGPLLLGMAGCYLGGLLTDYFVRRLGRRWGRRVTGLGGFGLCSLCYVAAIFGAHEVGLFAAAVALAGFFNDMTMGACWATCQDVGRRYAAIVAGSMNMIGNLGGALTNFVTGWVLKSHTTDGVTAVAGYQICFTMYAVAFAVGVLFWLRIDASKPLVPDEGH